MYRGEKPMQTKLAPEWTLEKVARHAVDFWLSTEDLPRPDNRVTLRDDGSIALTYTATNEVPKKRLLHELKSMLRHLGMHHDHLHPAPRLPQERHPGRRAAPTRPAPAASAPTRPTSVLDTDCQAHEVDNLYVVDTSFFPSIGAVNPALTAMANALRVGDHLLERMGCARDRHGADPCRVTDRALHVVIVGGGFGGVGCARELAEHDDVRVTLIDRNNYHQFQPLLYQVATSQLASSDIAYSLRKLFRDDQTSTSSSARSTRVDPAGAQP